MPSLLSARVASKDQDPFSILRLAAGGVLALATLLALIIWALGLSSRALLLLGAFWAIYGLIFGLIDGFLEPVIDLAATVLQDVGLMRYGSDYSGIETLAARGLYDAAANEYLARSQEKHGDPEALVRRAGLLAGPLENPAMAVMELDNFRDARRLAAKDDIKIGLALAELYERRLGDPGRAMTELRRLIDLHPSSRGARRIRNTLAGLRQARFGEIPKETQ